MDLTCGPPTVVVSDHSLQSWLLIGSGGFGQIYKARHKQLGMDVAIKLLYHGNGSPTLLLREADLMRQGNSPHVLRVLGVFQGCPPSSSSTQLGVVMEFIERGSLADLQDKLSRPPPWPLVFRIAHQIALGMNFLHHLPKPLLHLDLKPSNVLLDDSLKVKLADFGLAKVYYSVSKETKNNDWEEGGTINYMPPEAFRLSYQPTKASDIYSYGILLWSIITGEQPYPNAMRSVVRFRIRQGDRPCLRTVDQSQAPGLGSLVELMKTCWDTDPLSRPQFLDCLVVTEGLFEQHKQGICWAVLQVQNQLDSPNEIEQSVADLQLSDPPKPPAGSPKPSHHVKTGPPPKQETAGGLTSKERKTQLYQDWQQQFQPIESSPAAPAPFAANREPSLQPCVANPVQVTPSSLPNRPQNPGSKQAQPLKTPQSTPQYHRWNSTPVEVPRTGGAFGNVTMSHVNGVQIGNNNVMNISHHPAPGAQRQRQRHRNPTAPSSVQLPTEQPARSKDQP